MKCETCGAAMEVVGVHYDSDTGLTPIVEYECPVCDDKWVPDEISDEE